MEYLKEDAEQMLKLFRHVGPFYQEQQDLIYNMIRKYMDPNAPRPVAGCNCPQSYANAFNRLRDWYSQNSIKFQ